MEFSTSPSKVVAPYGGALVDLLAKGAEREELLRKANQLPSIQISARAMCDLEMMAVGALSPLDRFMGKSDYEGVLEQMRLANGTLFPIPVTLPVADPAAIVAGKQLLLRGPKNELVAILDVEEIYEAGKKREAQLVVGSTDSRHPLVAEMASWGSHYVSGPLKVLNLPRYFDFPSLRRTPAEVRQRLEAMGNNNVVAFHTLSPIHRADEELTRRVAERIGGSLLLHPVVGMTKPGDVDHVTRVRTYTVLTERHYDRSRTMLSLLPLASRMAGPREAVWHAIIRRNYGASHFIVGPDHASPGADSSGKPFFGPCDAQQLASRHASELGVTIVPHQKMVYLPEKNRFEEEEAVSAGVRKLSLTSTQVRNDYLRPGRALPHWFTRPAVAGILEEAYPPLFRQGFCVWFTGLPSSGKSTIAEVLTVMLAARGRHVTVLDGDVVRTHLSKGLSFSREDRDTNILRIGYVASEIVRHGGAVICAAVSPYRSTRDQVRGMVGAEPFIQTFVDTPVDICAGRDVKGFYARARAGEIKGFTGVDDPYEAPASPEITLTTTDCTPEANAARIIAYLEERGLVKVDIGAQAEEAAIEEALVTAGGGI